MKELIKAEIEKLEKGEVSERVKEYTRYNAYTILKDSITVTVRLKKGIEAVIDITDLVL